MILKVPTVLKLTLASSSFEDLSLCWLMKLEKVNGNQIFISLYANNFFAPNYLRSINAIIFELDCSFLFSPHRLGILYLSPFP